MITAIVITDLEKISSIAELNIIEIVYRNTVLIPIDCHFQYLLDWSYLLATFYVSQI